MFKEDIYSKSLHETGSPVMLSEMKESVVIRGERCQCLRAYSH